MRFCGILAVAAVLRTERNSTSLHKASGKAFTFEVHNAASFPLNVLALPKLMTVYAESRNALAPGETFTFRAAMGAYDFHVLIDDGENRWSNFGQAGWGLSKDGVALVIGTVAGVGLTGTLAVSAAAVATAFASAAAWPATLVVLATYGAFFGVAVFSSMTVTALTHSSMDFVVRKMELLLDDDDPRARLAPMDGASFYLDKERLLSFDRVVTEEPVRAAFVEQFMIDPAAAWLTQKTAEEYLTAMQARFGDWKVGKGHSRRFVIAGGFLPPKPLERDADGKLRVVAAAAEAVAAAAVPPRSERVGRETALPAADAYVVDFVPLVFGEVEKTHGCKLREDWGEDLERCEEECHDTAVDKHDLKSWFVTKPRAKWPAAAEAQAAACEEACSTHYRAAVDAEERAAERAARAAGLKGKQAWIVGFGPGTEDPEADQGRIAVRVDKVDGEKAYVVDVVPEDARKRETEDARTAAWRRTHGLETPTGGPEGQWLDLEQLSETPNGAGFGEVAPTYGRCWSQCDAKGLHAFWSGIKGLVARPANCPAVPALHRADLRGAHCRSDDECEPVLSTATLADAGGSALQGWRCAETCG